MRLSSKQMHKDVKDVSNTERCRCGKYMRGHVKSLMQVWLHVWAPLHGITRNKDRTKYHLLTPSNLRQSRRNKRADMHARGAKNTHALLSSFYLWESRITSAPWERDAAHPWRTRAVRFPDWAWCGQPGTIPGPLSNGSESDSCARSSRTLGGSRSCSVASW